VAVLVLLAGAGAVGVSRSRSDDQATAPGTSTTTTAPRHPSTTERTPPTTDPSDPTFPNFPADPTDPSGGGTPADPAAIQAEAKTIEDFVEHDRGLQYTSDVTVTVLAPAAFQQKVLGELTAESDQLRRQGDVLEAAGVIPAGTDVVAAQRKLLGQGVLGYYDPQTKELYVRGTSITPMLREIMAHELTHALDDQHFDLNRPTLDDTADDSGWAWSALVEGSAKRVEDDYVAQMSQDDKDELTSEQLQLGIEQLGTLSDVPLVLAQLDMSPYDEGEPFVRALVQRDGVHGIDAALGRPPATSEQVLAPDKYEAHEPPVPVDAPPADGTIVDQGTLGQYMTGILLHGKETNAFGGLSGLGGIDPNALGDLIDQILNGEIDPGQLGGTDGLGGLLGGSSGFPPVETVPGWGGDHYVLYRPSSGTECMRVDWKMDQQSDIAAMLSALRTWASGDPAITVTQPSGDTARATRCADAPSSSGSGSSPSTTEPSGGGSTTTTTPPTTASTPPSTPQPTTRGA
jgi:hypothetical protein